MKKNTLLFFVLLTSVVFSQTPGGVPTTNMSLWYSGDSNITDSGTLTWGDRSGSGFDAYQTTAAAKASQTDLMNFNESFTFDGTDDFFAVETLNYASGSTIEDLYAFVVYKTGFSANGTSDNWSFLDFDRSDAYNINVSGSGTLQMSYKDGGDIRDNRAFQVTNDNQPHIGTFIFDNAFTNETRLKVDGRLDRTFDRTDSDITITADRYGFVGDGSEASSENGGKNEIYYDGNIAEIILFDKGAITANEMLRIESYLALKYGVTLDVSNTNYVNSAGDVLWDNTDYWHNVGGLINDSTTSAINQKIAKSGDTGLIVATNDDFTSSNNAMSRTSLPLGDYLLFGENDEHGYTLFSSPNNYIFNKQWLFKEGTNDTGLVYVAFPKSEFPSGTTAQLIVSTDDVFDGTDTTYPLMDDGTYLYRAINLNDGDRITFITGAFDVPKLAGIDVTRFDLIIKADDIDSGSGLDLRDGSLNQANAFQTNTDRTPADAFMNFNPTLDFDGANDYLAIENKRYEAADVITDLHGFVVYSTEFDTQDANPDFDNWALVDFDRSESYNMFIRPDGKLAFSYQSSGTKDQFSESLGNDGIPHIAEFIFDSGQTNETFMKFDGNIEFNSDLTSGNIVVRNNSSTTPRYGFIGDGSEANTENGSRNNIYYDGQISEVIVADRTGFSDLETKQIETYLGLKYGVSLHPSIFDYRNSAGAIIWNNTDYWNGIAGLINDSEDSDIDQKVAQSTSAQDLIVATTNDFSSPNADASRTSVPLGTSLLFGSNGSGVGVLNFNPLLSQYLTSRQWLFTETGGNTGTVFVAIPKSFFPDDLISIEAIISTDDVFDNSDTKVTLTDDGTNYYFSRDMLDGERLAYTLLLPEQPTPGAVNAGFGLNMWVRADKGVTSTSGIISSVTDESFNGNGVVQSTNLDKPTDDTDMTNYNPTMSFDGVRQHFAVESLNFSSAGEIDKLYTWVVYKTDHSSTPSGTPDTSNRAFLDFDSSKYFGTYIGGDGKLGFSYTEGAGFGIEYTSTGTSVNNNGRTNIAGFIFDASTGANDTFIRSNGADDFTGDVNNSNIGTGVTRYGYVGDASLAATFDGGSSEDYYEGNISEIIYFQGQTIPDAEIRRIESYLAIKYGITLDNSAGGLNGNYVDSSGSVLWDAVANAAFHRNVAGIGADEDTALLQKQSRSEAEGGIVTVALGATVEASNVDNTTDFDDDKDYLLWGNNGTDAIPSLIDDGAPTGTCPQVFRRLDRDWKVVNIGSVGTVSVSFDMSTISNENNFDLLIDTDGDGDYTGVTPITTGVLTDDNLVFSSVNLPNGAVFTLRTKTAQSQISYAGGTWSGGSAPDGSPNTSDFAKSVSIEDSVSLTQNANCQCLSVATDAVVTVPTNSYLRVEGLLELDGDIYLEGDSELIQKSTGVNTNTGTGTIHKILDDATRSEFRYNYFASVVNTSGSFSLINNLKLNTGATLDDNTDFTYTNDLDGSGTTISRRWLHTMNNAIQFTEVDENESMNPGVGYTMKGTGVAALDPKNKYNFIGNPNNGDITVPVTTGNFLLTGNLYPSTINAHDFNTLNTGGSGVTEGIIYLWDQPGGSEHFPALTDNSGGYATIGAGMTVGAATLEDETTGVSGATTPTEYLRPGQGFIVYATADGDVKFDNSLRVSGAEYDGARHFFKTNEIKTIRPIIRLGFEFKLGNGKVYHRQLATALDGSSMAKEVGKDAFMFDYFNNDAYWVIEGEEDRFIITSVPAASDDLELPIGVVVDTDREITFTLDGVEDYTGSVYVYDKVENTVNNIKEDMYTAFVTSGETSDRFSLVFKGEDTLSNDAILTEGVKNVVSFTNNELEVTLEKGAIEKIEVYSLTGSTLLSYKETKETNHSVVKTNGLSNNFYIVKVVTNTESFTKKIYVE